jgi:cyclophilin family peptidyl-prolyl cis-trans isomerase
MPDEPSTRTFARGTLGMARQWPDAGAGQWFLTLAAQPQLDGEYTRFGHVTAGMEVVSVLTPEDRVIEVRIERLERR